MVSAGMTPRAALRAVTGQLRGAGCPDADFDALALFQLAVGCDPRLSETPLDDAQAAALASLAGRRAAREPLQYLCGRWPFLDFELEVGPGVLCPRADTETVIEALRGSAALAALTKARGGALQVLDLCAGTGALGLGFKRFWPRAEVVCVEKSPAAMGYLQRNARQALAPLCVRAAQGDLFAWWRTQPAHSLDVILCNPPYLTAAEMETLQPEVAREPAMALAGGADGLDFYRALAAHYAQTLRAGGMLALEIGWQQQAAVTALLQAAGWQDIAACADAAGRPRCVLACAPADPKKEVESNN